MKFKQVSLLITFIIITQFKYLLAKLVTTGGKLGDSVVLPCGVDIKEFLNDYDGKTPVLVNWFRHQGSTRNTQRPIYAKYLAHYIDYEPHIEREYENRIEIIDKINLNITNLSDFDEGLYECRLVFLDKAYAENKNGSLVYLQIYTQPEFENLSDEIYYYKPGTPLRLYCYATGKPSPSIIWYKNGIKLDLNGSQLLDSDLNEKTQFPIDYTCSAENIIGRVTYTMKVVRTGDVVFSEKLKNQTLVEGMLLNWPCKAQSNFPLSYKWFKDSIIVQTQVKNWTDRGALFQDGMFYLNEVNRHDSGLYECVAYTEEKRISTSAYLNVIYAPSKIKISPLVYSMESTRKLEIECPVDSNPAIHTYEWFKDDQILSNSKRFKIMSNGTLVINSINLNDKGFYHCSAQNILDKSKSNKLELKIIESKRIDSVHYAYDGQKSYKLPCDSPSKSKTQWFKMNSILPIGRYTIDSNGYLILFNLNLNDSANYLCLSENLNSKQIVGLIIFENTTSSNNNKQQQQQEINFKLTENLLPLAPLNLKVFQQSDKIHIQWTYPDKTAVKIEYYKVEYRLRNTNNWLFTDKILNDKQSFELDTNDLVPNQVYEFRIYSYSMYAQSKSSEIVSVRFINGEKEFHTYSNEQNLVSNMVTHTKSFLKISQFDIILIIIFIILLFILFISIIACFIYYKSSRKFKKRVSNEKKNEFVDNEWEVPTATFLSTPTSNHDIILGHGSLRYKQKATPYLSTTSSQSTTTTSANTQSHKRLSPDDEWLNTSNELTSNSNTSLREDQKELLRNKTAYRGVKVDYV